METNLVRLVALLCLLFTLIVPFVQLSIGFQYVVHDGQNADKQCAIAPDLPLLMAIGGIFTLFFLGLAYGFLKMLSSIRIQQSDIAGRMPRLLVGRYSIESHDVLSPWYLLPGLMTFIFGSITLIFFVLIQFRVYTAYSQRLQYDVRPLVNSCQPIVIHGALISIILTYFSLLLFIGIYVLVLRHACCQRNQGDLDNEKDFEMKMTIANRKF